VRLAANYTRESDVLSPILLHVAEIQYTNENSESCDMDTQTLKAWDDDDRSLSDVLYKLGVSKNPLKVIDLGEIQLGDYDGRIVALAGGAKFHLPNVEWLFLLPLLRIDGPSHDITELASNDVFSSCRVLQDAGKISLDARLKIVLPTEPSSRASLDLHLCFQLELIVSLVLPRAMEYTMHKRALKREIIAHEDAQRRLLRVAFGEDSVMSDEVDEPITVATFYNVMGPAPPLFSEEVVRSMQPDALLPTLLPFQCNSVAWLLQKEGMSILPNGSIVPQSSPAPFSFWKEIQVGNHTLYLHRLSGDLIDQQPELPAIHGGMLAEEPGLGKTLETIALILLNPAPPSWNPSLISWDDVACSNVRSVKVCRSALFEIQ
jgi:E3 ubiquitin-protein ligase SHPRH